MSSKRNSFANPLILFGLVLLVIASALISSIYFPILKQEILYDTRQVNQAHSSREEPPTPVDTDFGIVIEKIGANARVIANVDPFNPKDYQLALSRGVAQAKGSAFPGGSGTVFLFSHSSLDFFQATRYNSVFYLLDKLKIGDKVDLYYLGQKYTYSLTQKIIASPGDLSYLTGDPAKKTLTLMTCWPPGTSLQRLIWLGKLETPP